ncbi:hypothetical protein HanPSC8_Chr01g0020391 [Helianthus annuus]|nr:hypothetical protein HanPSC8_Chr01g0020391 [Helianthus annuus]
MWKMGVDSNNEGDTCWWLYVENVMWYDSIRFWIDRLILCIYPVRRKPGKGPGRRLKAVEWREKIWSLSGGLSFKAIFSGLGSETMRAQSLPR